MSKELLPIGTMVTLKDKQKLKFMIIGYGPIKEDGTKKDYVAVLYPIGALDNRSFLGFNQEEIEETVYSGYTDPLFEAFKEEYHKKEQAEEASQADAPQQDE